MRIERDQYFLEMAQLVARRSTCLRRSVGSVLVNARGHVLATGYNGVASGDPHCNALDPFDPIGTPHACPGSSSLSGTNLDNCQAIHAEQNALLQCHDVFQIETCYCTTSPCVTCVKLLKNTSCKRIVFLDEYPHGFARDSWLLNKDRIWLHFNSTLA